MSVEYPWTRITFVLEPSKITAPSLDETTETAPIQQ